MSFYTFIKQSTLLTIACCAVVLCFCWLYSDYELLKVYAAACTLFLLFNTGIFIYTSRLSTESNPYAFNNIIAASFIIKLILSVGFLITWNMVVAPTSKIHVIHYLIVYLVYTVHEVYFLTILAKKVK
jgi:hypothetical protein